ncbi:hypothetical protein GF360_00605 [candidate division WWE3 bacterium]|nr:hypothetical protein [candidate division WWE3 bacterium]
MTLMHITARLKYILLTILFIAGSVNMISTTKKVIKSSKRLNEAEENVLSLKEEQRGLLEEIKYKETTEYVGEVARDQLGLIKPGEEVYIYPDTEGDFEGAVSMEGSWRRSEELAPWRQWVKLVFW